ncbi:MAG TPA: mandelate racemase/muconate lactonizing enzyme family protein [Bryobacteraceae bacterium]|nr:mandelate racemase/muconate lactonizing enzyme family protein [Bryobacteraceae bacterium]
MISRRQMLKAALAVPVGAWMNGFRAFAAPYAGEVKITAIKALALDYTFDGCLIKIETDAGLSGYGETGTNVAMARSHIAHMDNRIRLTGSDPLSIERHFFQMTSMQHPFMPAIGTVSGIDIALWDLAGKITGRPVYKLLGGPFRDGCPMYSHGDYLKDMHDRAAVKDWVQRVKAVPEGFRAFKINIDQAFPIGRPFHPSVQPSEMRRLHRAYANVKEAAGDDLDIAVACHGEFDAPSSIAIARAIEPLDLLFLEDALNVPFSEAWPAVKRASRVPIMTGEKLEMVRGFKPFLDTQSVDIIHPDVSYAGGITGVKKIADYAAFTRTPVALHNVGSMIRTYASAHLSMAIENFYRSESRLGRPEGMYEQMVADGKPAVRNGVLHMSKAPGLGLTINEDHIRKHLATGEPYWG